MKLRPSTPRTVSGAISCGAAFWLVAGGAAFACSESLYRVGHGVKFREYTAPIPGNVLVIAKTEAEREFASWLASAGHQVKVVERADAVGDALKAKPYDVILGYFADRETIEAESDRSNSTAAFIPVVSKGSVDEVVAKATYRRTLTSDSGGRDYLKAIHKEIKNISRPRTQT